MNKLLTIITPCSRPENLQILKDSIFKQKWKFNFKWLIVHDSEYIEIELFPELNIYQFNHYESNSLVGHAQRNFALNLIAKGLVYFLDDDTILHPNFAKAIHEIEPNTDFIHFPQSYKNESIRISGKEVEVDKIDTGSFVFDISLAKDIFFDVNKYNADGYFAKAIYDKAKNPVYTNYPLSYYNYLR
jgi:hypothetical protein